jgi:hypothetical protein
MSQYIKFMQMSLLIIPQYKDKINYSDRRVFCFCIDKSQFVV